MLFNIEPRYCIDTNVIVSFLSDSDDEYYGADIFPDHWSQIETMITNGEIVAPRQVERELERHATKRERLGPWLRVRGYMFRDVDTDAQLDLAKRIVNVYPAYAASENYLGDLEVITLAGALGLSVISLEAPNQQSGKRRPKIPNVCEEFGVGCMSVAGLLRELKRRDARADHAAEPVPT
jgi:Domain of unknown function (DUF4411)